MKRYLGFSVVLHMSFALALLAWNRGSLPAKPDNSTIDVIFQEVSLSQSNAIAKVSPRPTPKKSFQSPQKVGKSVNKLESTFAAPNKKNNLSAEKETEQVEEGAPAADVSGVKLSYTQELKVFLERNKKYPRQAIRLKQSGTVRVRLQIDASGNFKSVKLIGASNFPVLDQAALELLRRLGKFKPLPSQFQSKTFFTVPIAYVLGRR